MNLGIVSSSVSREAGGLFEVTRQLALAMHAPPAIAVQMLGLRDRFTDADLPGWGTVPVTAFPPVGPGAFGFAPRLGRFLDDARLDLLHVHGLWMYPSLASLVWSRRRGGLLVSPHGMLDPWALNNGAWKKRLAGLLFEGAHLRRADCLHALTGAERDAIRAFGLRNPVCVVPNAVALPSGPPPEAPAWRSALPPDAKVLLYLGRLHPKKGLPALLRAWGAASEARGAPIWHLALAGWDQNNHQAELAVQAVELGLERVHVVGPQFGDAKAATYAHADAFVLPSLSEGLPLVVLEAWSHGLPVLMTPACNLPQGFAAGAALQIASAAEGIARGLQDLFASSDADRRAMGQRGRRLVESAFSWQAVGEEMRAVYAWVAGEGPRPASAR